MAGKKGYEGCEICGRELLLYKCKYCGKAFCEQHKAPERHDCAGMEEYRRQKAMGMIDKPGSNAPDVAEKAPAGHPKLTSLYKAGVFGVKVLSVIAVIAASVMALVLLVGYINANTPTWHYSIPVNNASDGQVVLVNYKNATDPTWNQLVAFLKSDDTIRTSYQFPAFTCADFARKLHDRAEANGIKCGFVAIEFYNRTLDFSIYDNGDGSFSPPNRSLDVGHGLNVFHTTDGRTVYIDASSLTDFASGQPEVRVAYVEEGQELNEIDLDYAGDTNYSFYESYKRAQLELIADQRVFYKDMAALNAGIYANGNMTTPILTAEADRLKAEAAELNERKDQLGPFYFPIGIVKKVDIYW